MTNGVLRVCVWVLASLALSGNCLVIVWRFLYETDNKVSRGTSCGGKGVTEKENEDNGRGVMGEEGDEGEGDKENGV